MTLRVIVESNPMIDVLLRIAGLPSPGEVEELLSKVEGVEVTVDCRGEEKLCRYVKLLLKGYSGVRVRDGEVARPKVQHDVPPPGISVGGLLGGRFRFHGLPEELLAPPFMLAVAAAGGAWKPGYECPRECRSGSLVAYVVPGVPCAKAIVMLVGLLLCCGSVEVDVVNVDTLAALGGKLPVDRVPSFYSNGRLRVGLPRGLEELVRMLEG